MIGLCLQRAVYNNFNAL